MVRTYPTPARKGVEVSCTAAITEDGHWIRLFPVPYRFLDEDRRFKKYQWVEAQVTRAAGDPRPESFRLNDQTIKIMGSTDWAVRWSLLRPLISKSLCQIQRTQKENRAPTLGIFKPASINKLTIEAVTSAWTAEQRAILSQIPMFQKAPAEQLEKIPFNFKYSFRCSEDGCKGHEMSCTDWEMGQSYRKWRQRYDAGWETKFRQRWESEMQFKYDTHFFVGTVHNHPNNWIIVGLFYPPRPKPAGLFPDL